MDFKIHKVSVFRGVKQNAGLEFNKEIELVPVIG